MSRQYEATVTKAIFAAAVAQNAGANYDVPIPGNIGGPFGASRCIIKGDRDRVGRESELGDFGCGVAATHPSDRNSIRVGAVDVCRGGCGDRDGDPSTSYRYFIPDLDVPYRDDDSEAQTIDATVSRKIANGAIHMTLIPRGAAHVINKEIVIKFFCEPDRANQ